VVQGKHVQGVAFVRLRTSPSQGVGAGVGVMHLVGLAPGGPVPRPLQGIQFAAVVIELSAEVSTPLGGGGVMGLVSLCNLSLAWGGEVLCVGGFCGQHVVWHPCRCR
jgi:hypothetical protein